VGVAILAHAQMGSTDHNDHRNTSLIQDAGNGGLEAFRYCVSRALVNGALGE